MKKKLLVAVLVSVALMTVASAQVRELQTVQVSEEQKIVYAMLMNQIQYSIATITHYQNSVVLDQEFDNIINKIDKSRLLNEDSITAYGTLLDTLTRLKLNENKRQFLKTQAERKKSQAVNHSLEGIGPAAGMAIANAALGAVQKDPRAIIQAISGLTFAGVSTYFNYRNAVNEAENSFAQDMFELKQQDLTELDSERNSLFKTYARFIVTYRIPLEYEIKEDQMKWLVETLDEKSNAPSEKVRLLEEKKSLFAIFLPFWYELGAAYQETGNTAKARECYARFEELHNRYAIITNDSYYTELAKNMLQLLQAEGNTRSLAKYLDIIEKDTSVATEAENRLYLAGAYYTLGNVEAAKKKLLLIIDEGRSFVAPARELYQIIELAEVEALSMQYRAIAYGNIRIASEQQAKRLKKAHKTELKAVSSSTPLALYLPSETGSNVEALSLCMGGKMYEGTCFSEAGFTYWLFNLVAKNVYKVKIRVLQQAE